MAETFISCINRGISIRESILHAISASLFDAFGILEERIVFDRKILIENCVLEVKKFFNHVNFRKILVRSNTKTF